MLVVLISFLIASFAFIYVGGIQTNQQELKNLPQAIPVTARIISIDGTQIAGLEISENVLDKISNTGYIKDLYYSARLGANFSSTPDEKNKYKRISIRSVNIIDAIPNYEECNIELAESVSLDFLCGIEAKCIANDVWLQMNDLSVGDDISINLYGYKYESDSYTFKCVPLGTGSLRIVGSMSSSDSGASMDLLCPTGWAKEMHAAAGVDFYLDSAEFTVADPLNLDQFKAAMKKCYLMPVNPDSLSGVYGSGLSVHDETFIKAAARLKSHLTMLYGFAAVVFVIIALLGYALAYLFIQSRSIEVVLMRSLGTSQKSCVLIMFFEYAALGLSGSLLGLLCSVVLMGFAGAGQLLAFLMFFVSFVLGIAGAAHRQSKRTAMSGFVKAET